MKLKCANNKKNKLFNQESIFKRVKKDGLKYYQLKILCRFSIVKFADLLNVSVVNSILILTKF